MLNAEARKLEARIAENVTKLLEREIRPDSEPYGQFRSLINGACHVLCAPLRDLVLVVSPFPPG